jgi:hypothetical protein
MSATVPIFCWRICGGNCHPLPEWPLVPLDFNLQPRPGRPGPINRSQSLAYDPFQPELADGLIHPVAMTFSMFQVLDAGIARFPTGVELAPFARH